MPKDSTPAGASTFFARDLLGDPVPVNHLGRGRPSHCKTEHNALKVRTLLAFGWSVTAIARALRITRSTLRKHYSTELRHAEEAREALVAGHLMALVRGTEEGNASCIKQLGEKIARAGLEGLVERAGEEQPAAGSGQAAPWAAGRRLDDTTPAGSA